MEMSEILICGAGVGGLVTAHRLRKILPAADRITVFDQAPEHTFSPSLPWVMTGTRRAEQVTKPLRTLREQGITMVNGMIEAIDPATRSVRAAGQAHQGDALVIALGAALEPGVIPGLADGGDNIYTLSGATAAFSHLQTIERGKVVVLISRVPFKCPAAPYEAAMLVDGYLRKMRRREAAEVEVWAAEGAPMGVAGQEISGSVVDALAERQIAYHPGETVTNVDAANRLLHFESGRTASYDLLLYVPPHQAPRVVVDAGLAPKGGWIMVDRQTLETSYPNVFAIGDVTSIPLSLGKPLPKAGVFAHAQGEVVAQIIRDRLQGRKESAAFDGHGECFIEMGAGRAGFARGNFYAEPSPAVRAFRPGRHWHAAKVAFERHWWSQWW